MNNPNTEYLIIDKSILPEYFDLVLKAKSLVEDEDVSVSLACKQTGISRSTFYKYKDKIYRSSKSYGKKSIISFKLADSPGVLSSVVQEIYSCGGNIITINSGLPIKGITFTTLVIDVSTLKIELTELVRHLKMVDNVKSVNIVAVE
ncbi:MAG: ACT domain-containing protein [Clostridia bacterium]|nr:ACT domain-containing protein [Clostridia bacterium]MBR6688171.1 ACT domain-containing protein [Clostridia bacterium]